MDFLAAAELLAEKSGLKIVTKRNGAGEVMNYRLYRVMPKGLVFLGSRSSAEALLGLVELITKVPA